MPGTYKQDQSPKAKEATGPRGGLTLAALLYGLAVKQNVYTHSLPCLRSEKLLFTMDYLLLQILIAGHSVETK